MKPSARLRKTILFITLAISSHGSFAQEILESTYIGFGSASKQLLGSPHFTWNDTVKKFRIGGGVMNGWNPIEFAPPVNFHTMGKTALPYRFMNEAYENANGTFNMVSKYGINIDGEVPTQAGIWDAYEYYWNPDNAYHHERHYQYYHPSGTHIRLFSSTLVEEPTVNETTNVWDFRCTNFNVRDLENNTIFSVSKANGPNTFASAILAGQQPIFRLYDDVNGNFGDIQYNNNQFSWNRSVTVTGEINGINLFLNNNMGATGTSGLLFQKEDGNYTLLSQYGTGATNGRANVFEISTSSTGKIPLRITATSNVQLNAGELPDEGSSLQVNATEGKAIYANGSVQVTGAASFEKGIYKSVTIVYTNTALNENHYTVLVDASMENISIALPTASSVFKGGAGIVYHIKRIDNSGNTVTIAGSGCDMIDGSSSIQLTAQHQSKTIQSAGGTSWYILNAMQ